MDARVNARELAHALLTQIENRGSHASGFAWYGADGSYGVYKQPRPGSQLALSELPRDAKTVILHTRYATQGSPQDNRNNHPVVSTDNRIALVHNGVISNDGALRADLGITRAEHGEVDSLVIPSLIAQEGVKSLSRLSGYAAIAWLDGNEDGQLHIAKLKQSPVSYTHLPNGTFVMASTSALLEMALITINYEYGGVFDLSEGRMLEVHGGFIAEHDKAPSMSYNHQAYNRYSSATAGGHGTARTPAKATSPATPAAGTTLSGKAPVVKGSEDSCSTDLENYYEDLEKWREKNAKKDLENQGRPAVLFEPGDIDDDDDDEEVVTDQDTMSDEEWDDFILRMEEAEELRTQRSQQWASSEYLAGEGFYVVDAEGNITHHPVLEDLEAYLRWLSKMQRGEWDLYQGLGDNMNWVNHIMDLGAVDADGNLDSWVDDTAGIDTFESPAVRNLQYIREGAHLLERLKGA